MVESSHHRLSKKHPRMNARKARIPTPPSTEATIQTTKESWPDSLGDAIAMFACLVLEVESDDRVVSGAVRDWLLALSDSVVRFDSAWRYCGIVGGFEARVSGSDLTSWALVRRDQSVLGSGS